MKILFEGGGLRVIKEPTDKNYYGTANAAGESNFLYDLKKELNKKGFSLIKKRMYKDGHLVDDMQQYLRTDSNKSNSPHVYIYSNFWALRGLNDDFNKGEVYVAMDFDAFSQQPECRQMVSNLLTQ